MSNGNGNGVHKRLVWVVSLLAGVGLTCGLLLYALSGNIDFFYTPRDIILGKDGVIPHIGQRMQVGGMVMPNSVVRDPDSLAMEFVIYDKSAELYVQYEGTLPDLFEEGQSVVVKGVLTEKNVLVADTILAKHDENYTPPEVEEAMQENHLQPESFYKPATQEGSTP